MTKALSSETMTASASISCGQSSSRYFPCTQRPQTDYWQGTTVPDTGKEDTQAVRIYFLHRLLACSRPTRRHRNGGVDQKNEWKYPESSLRVSSDLACVVILIPRS